jgi:GWxTD domain-containing protein
MRFRPSWIALVLGLLAVVPASAELSARWQEWGKGPVAFLFTAADREVWSRVTTDDAAADFERLFWARRDPRPETPVNEARVKFEQLVAAADQRFKDGDKRGALTDRGRVLIVLGPPNRLAKEGGSAFEGAGDSDAGGGGRGSEVGGGEVDFNDVVDELWIYEKDRLPEGAKTNRLTVRFRTEPGGGTGAMNIQGQVVHAMEVAVNDLVKRPDLTLADLPAVSAVAPGEAAAVAWGAQTLTDANLVAALGADLSTFKQRLDADLDASAFQASDGTWEVVTQVMPRSAPTGPLDLVGVVRDASGADKLEFRRSQPWKELRGHSYQTQGLALPPGTWDVRLGLVDPAGQLSWAGSRTVTIPESNDFWLSDVIVSEDIFPLKQAQDVHEPWAWEGVAVVPRGGGHFAPGAGLWFYLHACNPQVGPDGKPALRLSVEILGPRRMRGPMSVEPSAAGPRCYVLASGIDLTPARFPPGAYQLKVQVNDTLSGKSLAGETTFTVDAAAPSSTPAEAPAGAGR